MVLLQAALRQAVEALRNAGVEEPRLDAELLLGHTLRLNRAAILARPDRPLTPKELTRFRDLITRRTAREPLPYITGHREFFGLDFVVDARVLIPRPETELLIEHALRIAKSMSLPAPPPLEIADVGAGSGAIAVTLAVHLPHALVYALDASPGALAVTAENARRHRVAGRVHCLQGDLLAPLPGPVHLMTANLPYVAAGDLPGLLPEIRDYEPLEALVSGPNGLEAIHRLAAAAGPYLHPGGALLLEIGASQGAAVTALARRYFPAADIQVHRDYAGLDRLVIVRLLA
jgi:release factor glutamine methyltransferase